MSFGRPTLYQPEFCDQLEEHMSRGMSFESFAGKIGVHFDTLYEWCKVQPDFSEAKKRGVAKSLVFWEETGIDGTKGQIEFFNSGTWIFNMKNRFNWRDKVEVAGDQEKPIQLKYKL